MKKILIVEDQPFFVRIIRFNLQRAGFDVITARNGREALAVLDDPNQTIDLIIADYRMPEMDGRELCMHLRESGRWASTPVILVTAKGLEVDISQLQQELGVLCVFSKPFSPRELSRTIENHFGAASNSE